MTNDDTLNYAMNELQNGTSHLYMTGNAGTGKSTLIKKYIEANQGEVIVLAPTGIAAINIGGQTIHSFFKLPARSISQNSIKFLDHRNPQDFALHLIIKRAKAIVIDEISMVRADLMDCIMWFFQKNYPKLPPFGGKKIIMIGDLNQLPPVIAEEADREMIATRYESEYFFHSKAWTAYANFKTITLTKIWRQSDPEFIGFLGKLKNNEITQFDIDKFNQKCYLPNQELSADMGIVLCSTNRIAGELNQRMIQMEEGEPLLLEGRIEGNFNNKNCPVDQCLNLKIGCKIMTVRNGPGYANGSIGTLLDYDKEIGLTLEINGHTVFVKEYEFESIEYKYDKEMDKIVMTSTGNFYQYPVRVAYAITIHKSQGATFDKIIIDFGDRGAFAHGQAYVAISRATSMEGINLRYPLNKKDLIYSKSVLDFNNRKEYVPLPDFLENPLNIQDINKVEKIFQLEQPKSKINFKDLPF